MGRWSQRTRAGGGPPPPSTLISIISFDVADGINTTALYNGVIDSADFGGADFESHPSGANVIGISQLAPNQLSLVWGSDITTDTDFVYNGTVPGVTSPQTIGL